jgi:ATP-dependent RNA helicase DDX55/SPB4
VRQLVLADRDLLEKGTKAFVSFVRSYKEHQLQFIFQFRQMHLGHLADAFALLQLPKMKEFREGLKGSASEFQGETDEVVRNVRFKDKTRQKQRVQKLRELREKQGRADGGDGGEGDEGGEGGGAGGGADSGGGGGGAGEKRSYSQDKGDKLQHGGASGGQKKPPPPKRRKKGKNQMIFDEWDELAREEALAKKLRNKKITQAQYDAATGGFGGEDEFDDAAFDTRGVSKKNSRSSGNTKIRKKYNKFQKAQNSKGGRGGKGGKGGGGGGKKGKKR